MISKEEVQHIAKLARLQLTEAEVLHMQKDLTSILDYFEVLKKAPKVAKVTKVTKGMKVAKSKKMIGELKDGLRKDVAIERPTSLASNLVQAAPDKKDDYFKVKAIL